VYLNLSHKFYEAPTLRLAHIWTLVKKLKKELIEHNHMCHCCVVPNTRHTFHQKFQCYGAWVSLYKVNSRVSWVKNLIRQQSWEIAIDRWWCDCHRTVVITSLDLLGCISRASSQHGPVVFRFTSGLGLAWSRTVCLHKLSDILFLSFNYILADFLILLNALHLYVCFEVVIMCY